MSMHGIQIRFIPGLETEEVVSYDSLTLLDDSQSPIGVIERDA
jgi:hypothetical protein